MYNECVQKPNTSQRKAKKKGGILPPFGAQPKRWIAHVALRLVIDNVYTRTPYVFSEILALGVFLYLFYTGCAPYFAFFIGIVREFVSNTNYLSQKSSGSLGCSRPIVHLDRYQVRIRHLFALSTVLVARSPL